ncbi:hypothetical protein SEA_PAULODIABOLI_58 [Microbacterium phage PauloDiaboli]|nr:hypothetical protein SEA_PAULODIABOLI_58 [Microbacterium phage PauloDiaboli]
MSSPSVVRSSMPILNPNPITSWQTNFSGNRIWVAQTNGLTITPSSITSSATTFTWSYGIVNHTKVRGGKYRVRCRGCSRWAKILEERGYVLKVECKRCFGENEGYIS